MKLKKKKLNSRMQILVPVFAFIVIVLIVLIIVIPSTKDAKGIAAKIDTEAAQEESVALSVPEAARQNEAAENTDHAVSTFFDQYYTSMAEGDTQSLLAMYDNAEDVVINASAVAPLIEGYENIRIYTADGFRDDEIAAFVYSDVKFANVDTTAPSVDSFYLSDQDGDIRIMSSMYEDENIAEYLTLLAKKNPVKSIMENTDFWLETTLQNDEALKDIYTKMQEAISSKAAED